MATGCKPILWPKIGETFWSPGNTICIAQVLRAPQGMARPKLPQGPPCSPCLAHCEKPYDLSHLATEILSGNRGHYHLTRGNTHFCSFLFPVGFFPIKFACRLVYLVYGRSGGKTQGGTCGQLDSVHNAVIHHGAAAAALESPPFSACVNQEKKKTPSQHVEARTCNILRRLWLELASQ